TILIVDDSNDTVGRTVTLVDGSVTGLSPAAVTWTATLPGTVTGVARLILDGGAGNNTFNVHDTDTFYQYEAIAPGTGTSSNTVNVHATTAPLYVYGNGGSDPVTVGTLAAGLGANLAGIQRNVNVIGYGGVTSLIVDDQGTTADELYDVSATQVERLTYTNSAYVPNIAPITYSGIGYLAVYGGSGGNLLNIDSTAAETITDVYGGAGNDTFRGGPSLDVIRRVSINGNCRNHSLTVDHTPTCLTPP